MLPGLPAIAFAATLFTPPVPASASITRTPLNPRCGPVRQRLRALGAMLVATLGASALLGSAPARAQADACSVVWRVTPQLERQSAALRVTLQFDAGRRAATRLRLPDGWAQLTPLDERSAQLQPVAGDERLRQLQHAPGERVQLAWTIKPSADDASGVLLGADWLAWRGDAVLPWPEDALQPAGGARPCLDLDAPPQAPLLISAQGIVAATSTRLRLPAQADAVQHALYASGAFAWREVDVDGMPLRVARPTAMAGAPEIDALSARGARVIAAQRRFWRDDDREPQLLVLLPAPAGSAMRGAMALQRSIVMQGPPASSAAEALPIETWVAEQNQRQWMLSRFGPMRHAGRDDLALRTWFTDGVGDYLAHRLLLREGLWTPADQARAVNTLLKRWSALPEPDADNLRVASGRAGTAAPWVLPALRGEWQAFNWDRELVRGGHAGLESLMRTLWLPAAASTVEAPLSVPLATHRLVAALRRQLGDDPLPGLTRHVEEGHALQWGSDTLGPCLAPTSDTAPPQYDVHAGAAESSACQAWMQGRSLPMARAATAAAAAAGVAAATSRHGGKGSRAGKASAKGGKSGTSGKAGAKPGGSRATASPSKPGATKTAAAKSATRQKSGKSSKH